MRFQRRWYQEQCRFLKSLKVDSLIILLVIFLKLIDLPMLLYKTLQTSSKFQSKSQFFEKTFFPSIVSE